MLYSFGRPLLLFGFGTAGVSGAVFAFPPLVVGFLVVGTCALGFFPLVVGLVVVGTSALGFFLPVVGFVVVGTSALGFFATVVAAGVFTTVFVLLSLVYTDG